jgi:hypothetical protein
VLDHDGDLGLKELLNSNGAIPAWLCSPLLLYTLDEAKHGSIDYKQFVRAMHAHMHHSVAALSREQGSELADRKEATPQWEVTAQVLPWCACISPMCPCAAHVLPMCPCVLRCGSLWFAVLRCGSLCFVALHVLLVLV